MGDLNVFDYLGYAFAPTMMRMAQSRQDEIDKQRLGAFRNLAREFELGGGGAQGSEGGMAGPEVPEEVRESFKRIYGLPWPTSQREAPEAPNGMNIEHARLKSADEMTLHDAAIKGRAGGVTAGEQALVGTRYAPNINDAKLGEIARVLSQTGEGPGKYDIAGSVAGITRRQPKIGELPNSMEAVIARDPNMSLGEKILKLGELSKLKQRETAAGQPRTLEALIVEKLRNGQDATKELEMLRQANASRRAEGESPEAKDLKRMEDDIMQVAGRLASIQSGQNMMDSAMASERPQVVQQLQGQLDGMLDEYKARGGNPSRLGIRTKGGGNAGEMQEKPSAASNKGKVIRDTVTGKRYKSDGKTWVEIK